jgi:CheY-like chemotaxis protein
MLYELNLHWHGPRLDHSRQNTAMHPHTVLIADDDRLLRESLSDVLISWGCTTHQVGTGGSAIDVLRSQPCDLLLSDIDMPDMSGFELLSWVHEHPTVPHTPASARGWQLPVVLMSARADRELGRVALGAGAMVLLSKPVEIGRLSTLVHQLFDR